MKKSILLSLALLGLSQQALANDCTLEVGVADSMTFTPAALEISASQCKTVTVNLTHNGKLPRNAMGHNWALAKTEDAQAVAQAGWSAGLDNQYLPPDDARVIAATDIIGGGEKASVTFDTSALTAGGDYTFFCSFVGHFAIMKGKFTVTE
ncbi:azurin [Aliiglaciecola sp. CAU 1673]|uniref:azurin n=1 Tax=Aliiglaciecola sp. CAU 1673 TaxID=3032595 RepID=UPI0023DC2B8F|nr:azurin [Aliiglaciecola sp. CAU 1673]MDF2178167.1 azurin [Aliiglaciecola sp. CAU 1673]